LADTTSLRRDAQLVFPQSLHRKLLDHLFPGDFHEHAAVIAAGLARTPTGPRLLVREVWPAQEPQDYRVGPNGHMGLQATFIHRWITRCRDQRLVYLAVHNHGGSGRVAFSSVDIASHEKGYRALLDIANGMPVGAVVMADGAIEIDLWHPAGPRSTLQQARILGPSIERVYSNRNAQKTSEGELGASAENYCRQILFLGEAGQALFKRAKVAIIGLGGIGSIVSEYLARLGVGHLVLIDPDLLESSNTARVIGSRPTDLGTTAGGSTLKIDIAERVAREAQPDIIIEKFADDFARDCVARRVLDCDFLFLAADSMRARLVFNAVVNQYYIPGVQLGTKVRVDPATGHIDTAFSVVRNVRPGEGCLLCNQLIDPARLADEWKTDAESEDQQYGLRIPNPSVITMNAVAAAHAVNDFLFTFTGTRSGETALYRRFDHLQQSLLFEQPRRDADCLECSHSSKSRLGFGDAKPLPTAQ
jgi:hypothetical protein